MGMHILTLDSNKAQTSGAERWEGRVRRLIHQGRKGKEGLGNPTFEEGKGEAVETGLNE